MTTPIYFKFTLNGDFNDPTFVHYDMNSADPKFTVGDAPVSGVSGFGDSFYLTNGLKDASLLSSITSRSASYRNTVVSGANAAFGSTLYHNGGVITDDSVDSFAALSTSSNDLVTLNGKVVGSTTMGAAGQSMMSCAAMTDLVNLVTADTAAIAALSAGQVRTVSSFTPSLVGTGATGTLASKFTSIKGTFSTQFTYSLAGNPASNVVMKICATNNATEASWTIVGQTGFDQQSGLAVTVGQSIRQIGQITADVPAGYYFKFVNSGAGTHSEAVIAGQQTVYG